MFGLVRLGSPPTSMHALSAHPDSTAQPRKETAHVSPVCQRSQSPLAVKTHSSDCSRLPSSQPAHISVMPAAPLQEASPAAHCTAYQTHSCRPRAVQVYLQTAPGAEEGWNANFSSMMTKLLQESYDGSKVQRDAQQRTEALATAAEVPGLPPLPDLPPKVSGVWGCIVAVINSRSLRFFLLLVVAGSAMQAKHARRAPRM